ncbi:DNA/RNA non-specific endonuclease [Sphingomonas sp. S1-29]|uniref:DNA/RNA non-specific endonuclease n=1 Tax=Sphingomonas sp. S1-29 TaxID=2991074 RepID=UPI0022404078|nr:DNA/RNA non-specific endonuclease [Sphingomonas sp. S1-29]UZK70465.1 DNA/RNA non-specific endonuclease [Sphingomonas sp. S1-29]
MDLYYDSPMIRLNAGIQGCAKTLGRAALIAAATICAAPALASDGELHSFHCLFGCPVGAPATNDTIVREIYTLSSNDLTKLADWVAYRVTPASIGPSPDRGWRSDPSLATDETLTPDAYEGANQALRTDRGHQAPLAAFSGTPFAADTNILSNITPQASALNQGPWNALEGQERSLAQRLNTAVYIYTGPLFERLMGPLPAGPVLARVPSGYWKVVALADGRVSAFVFDQATPRTFNYCDGRVSLTHVVLRSRFILFPMANTASFGSLDTEIGCTSPRPADPAPSTIPGK